MGATTAEAVRALRTALGMSIDEFSAAIQRQHPWVRVDGRLVKRWEAGKERPTLPTRVAIGWLAGAARRDGNDVPWQTPDDADDDD